MSASTVKEPDFPAVLVDSLLSQLSLPLRNHIIFAWAQLFTKCAIKDASITDILSTITSLDFSSHCSLNVDHFLSLSHLPLANLQELNLSHIPLTERLNSEILGTISTSPVFDHLESLNLCNTRQRNLDCLFCGPNSFPKLTTLNLSSNRNISIRSLFNTNKLHSLKYLELSNCDLQNYDLKIMTESTVAFNLESLNISKNFALRPRRRGVGSDLFVTFFKASSLSHIKDLNLASIQCDLAALSFLLDDQAGPFAQNVDHHPQSAQQPQKDRFDTSMGYHQFSRLCLDEHDRIIPFNQKLISDLSSSSIVSNLTQLSIGLGSSPIDLGVLGASKYISNLKELSINFNQNGSCSLAPLLCPPGGADFPHFRLDKLEIFQAKLSSKDIRALCTTPCLLSTLKSLSLVNCDAGNGEDRDNISEPTVDWANIVELLSQSTIISKLTHLELKSLPLSFGTARSVLPSVKSLLRSDLLSSDLVELNLCGNELDAECIEIITSRRVDEGDENSPLKFGRLQKLDVGNCGLPNGSLASISRLTGLKHLDIAYYRGDDGDDLINTLTSTQETLPFLPKLANLTHLNLLDSNVTDAGAIILSQSQLLNGLIDINLSHNHIEDPGLGALVTTKLVSKLKVLNIQGNHGTEVLPPHFAYLDDCEVFK